MAIPVETELKQIFDMQRYYPWPRPQFCPRHREAHVLGEYNT
jgi:hypothetical protein